MESSVTGDNWQRIFYVSEHVKHKKGLVLFKIVSIVYFKGQPEAATKISVWKHYNEIKQLYKGLKQRHKRLRISEEFPPFFKQGFFSRHSDDTIVQEKQCILTLLQYVSRHNSLFTSDVFVKFFQEGYDLNEAIKNKDQLIVDEDADALNNLKLSIMGQVLQSEGSQSSDESISNETTWKKAIRPKKQYGDSQDNSGRMPLYWEEAIAHGDEASQQEVLGNHDIAFAMYKTAIVCLLSGVQGDNDSAHRLKVKEKTSQYLMKAEWIYSNHLILQTKSNLTLEGDTRIPWRSRSQMKRYKILDIVHNNILVHDILDDILLVVKGVLKSGCPLDRSERCILPKNVPYMVKLYGIHETETTVFFVLEHARYGRLWDHLEHYFSPEIICENAESEITCVTPQQGDDVDEDGNSSADSVDDARSLGSSSNNSRNNSSLSRLESSMYTTDTLSCESLNSSYSRDASYFDLVEDYARAKNEKLREIQDFHDRQKHMETRKLVKKTASQVDLKSADDDNYYRSQSLNDLAHEDQDDCVVVVKPNDVTTTLLDSPLSDRNKNNNNKNFSDSDDNVDDRDSLLSYQDIDDTQRLLRNAQKLIESINETLMKSENMTKENNNNNPVTAEDVDTTATATDIVYQDEQETTAAETELGNVSCSPNLESNELQNLSEDKNNLFDSNVATADYKTKYNASSIIRSPGSETVPSITEEYSATAILQRSTGLSEETVKKWAAQLLIALDVLHQNGIICRDLNPDNILLSDDGSVKLTYFYRYPNVDNSFNCTASERFYTAPEVTAYYSNASFAADWWSYGAILYELITLKSLYESQPDGINSHTFIFIPEKLSVECRSLLRELLKYDPNDRLGCGISGADDIKSHPYFSGICWDDL